MAEIAGDGGGLLHLQGVAHGVPDNGAADEHGGGGGEAAQHEGGQGGVDTAVIEQAVHGRLTAQKLLAGLHHPLEESDAVEHQQSIDGVIAQNALLQSRQNGVHGQTVEDDDHHRGDSHDQVDGPLECDQDHDERKDNGQFDQ